MMPTSNRIVRGRKETIRLEDGGDSRAKTQEQLHQNTLTEVIFNKHKPVLLL